MDDALHTSDSITALTHTDGSAVLTESVVTAFAPFYTKAFHT